jgi:hypothetical protein
MLSLDSTRWLELTHAYGTAHDMPALLRQLYDPDGIRRTVATDETWEALWSALIHQGSVFPASFAAVPYVVAAFERDPEPDDFQYLAFPVAVELSRLQDGVTVPIDLERAYTASLAKLPDLVAHIVGRPWSEPMLRSALAAIAITKGQPGLAEAVLELTPDVAGEFIAWQKSR